MKRYQKGERITNISQIDGDEFIYMNDKVTHAGWYESMPYRTLRNFAKRGCLWKAIKIEEDKA